MNLVIVSTGGRDEQPVQETKITLSVVITIDGEGRATGVEAQVM